MRLLSISTLVLLTIGCASTASEEAAPDDSTQDLAMFEKSPNDAIEIGLDANLQELFAKRLEQASNKNPEAMHETVAKKPQIDGKLQTKSTDGKAVTLSVHLTMHGNSSLGACAFPKLTVKIDKPASGQVDPRVGTPFAGVSKFFLRTHCADHSPTELVDDKRIANAVTVRREALAYRIVEAFEVPTHQVRLATVHYRDTGKTEPRGIRKDGSAFEVADTKNVTRDAFILEDEEDMAKRVGGDKALFVDPQKTRPWSDNPMVHIGAAQVARVALVEQLLSNVDWMWDASGELSQMEGGLKNLEIVRKADKTEKLVPYDFDISLLVTQRPLPELKLLDLPPESVTAADLTAAAHAMEALVPKVLAVIDAFPLAANDAAAKKAYRARVEAFKKAASQLPR